MQLSQGCADVPSRLKIFQMVTLQKTFLSDIAGRSTAESDIKIPLYKINKVRTKLCHESAIMYVGTSLFIIQSYKEN
jgi:hypothetical protein